MVAVMFDLLRVHAYGTIYSINTPLASLKAEFPARS